MSVILEALRKSEAERQRGRAPGLFVEQAVARKRTGAWSRTWPWLLGTLLLVVLAAWGWREWSRAPAAIVVVPASPVPAHIEPPMPAPQAAAVPPVRVEPGPRGIEAAGPGAAIMDPGPAPVGRGDSPAAAALPSMPVAAQAPPAAPVEAPVAAPPMSEPLPASEPVESLPTVASLGASERSQLPPLKLSMHVYADVPAQRFVILDGQRLAEGASPAPGLVLEQIRRDGLVLSVNGQRLLLARP